jgi:cell division inhibitor SepF
MEKVNKMSLFGKLRDLFDADDEYEDEEEFADEPDTSTYQSPSQKTDNFSTGTRSSYKREPIRNSLGSGYESEKNISFLSREAKDYATKYKIVVFNPRSYNDCPKLVDSLKSRKPVIINLENVEDETAKKIYYYLLGAVYALDGNVHKIAQSIFIFMPENAEVQIDSLSNKSY